MKEENDLKDRTKSLRCELFDCSEACRNRSNLIPLRQQLARYLPNASFIGSTDKPIEKRDSNRQKILVGIEPFTQTSPSV